MNLQNNDYNNFLLNLKKEFPGIQGFSKQNLWNMVKFFEFYSKNSKLQPLSAEISWSNNIIILEKCENNYQIEYYLKLSKKTNLSKRVLQNKIESQEFERVLSTNKINNFDLTLKEENLQIVENTIKDNYIFDFLSLGDEYKENMGLTNWKFSPNGPIRKNDVCIAKNYLNEAKLDFLNRIVSMYLDYAEDQAKRQIPMTMNDWETKLNAFLKNTILKLKNHYGNSKSFCGKGVGNL